jgi:hypothetical protein
VLRGRSYQHTSVVVPACTALQYPAQQMHSPQALACPVHCQVKRELAVERSVAELTAPYPDTNAQPRCLMFCVCKSVLVYFIKSTSLPTLPSCQPPPLCHRRSQLDLHRAMLNHCWSTFCVSFPVHYLMASPLGRTQEKPTQLLDCIQSQFDMEIRRCSPNLQHQCCILVSHWLVLDLPVNNSASAKPNLVPGALHNTLVTDIRCQAVPVVLGSQATG